ncbi:hypothetical protein CHS0354_002366 [Potamilus streckersoni]|uniref:Telomere length regulation protein TEL2 homolog n=1 Tax=Potamilus streckersoni TaxID=2493646 RepID=A0AAE0SNX7_9BIVA|nr:hypothetical protein CHS0354_002366 [Potamilus streckersoni]
MSELVKYQLETEVKLYVKNAEYAILNSKSPADVTEVLKGIHGFLSTPPLSSSTTKLDSDAHILSQNADAQAIFLKFHYARFGDFLLKRLSVDHLKEMSRDDVLLYIDGYFINGNATVAFQSLCQIVSDLGYGFNLNKCSSILEELLQRHRLYNIIVEECGLCLDPDVHHIDKTLGKHEQSAIWDELASKISSLPDVMVKKLKNQTSDIFIPKNYVSLVASDIYLALREARTCIQQSRDCSLEFLSRLFGKLCLSGYAAALWGHLARPLSEEVREDSAMSLVCETFIMGVSDRCIESVLTPLMTLLPWYGVVSHFLGDSVTKKQKVQYLLCTKLVFHRYYKDVLVLQNIIGYLGSSQIRQHLFIKLLYELVQVWGDKSSLRHMSREQHFYITQALIISIAFITEQQKEENRQELLHQLMQGVQSHIDSTDHKIRRLGMIVAENFTAHLDPDGPVLKFEYEKDEETALLEKLLKKPEDHGIEKLDSDLNILKLESEPLIKASGSEASGVQQGTSRVQPDLDLDSDDDLVPYDMSDDVKVTKVKQPKYIRDCMEGLIISDDPERVEVCLAVAETLIRSNPDGLQEISVEFTKILLHLSDSLSLPGFAAARLKAMVALCVLHPTQVADYLTNEFYDRNYNIRQRLDMLEVLASAAQELSQPVDPQKGSTDVAPKSKIQELKGHQDGSETWQQIVQKRIDSKTRRFAKGRTKPEPTPVPNRFAPVAGYFFYPLMKNFDRKENALDLLGEDVLLLGRLVYTLGMVMYAAINIPNVRHMGSALLEFIWVLRFHKDSGVRQALLFAVAMVFLAVPAHYLITDLQEEVGETKIWLEDIIDKDPNTHCKTSAMQSLVVLENSIKQELERGPEFT